MWSYTAAEKAAQPVSIWGAPSDWSEAMAIVRITALMEILNTRRGSALRAS